MKQILALFFLLLLLDASSQGITATVTTNSTTCNGACNGSAFVNASGGNTPYSYFWSPSGGTGQSASLLCGGSYSVMVTDSDGRTVTAVGTVQQPPPIQFNFTTTGSGCNTMGSATVSAYNANAPYTYTWSHGAGNSTVISNVAAGIYSLSVTDASNCSRMFTLSVPSNTTSSFLTIAGPSTLCGNNNGTFTVSGGSAYLWSNNSTASVSTFFFPGNVPQNTASVTVTGTQAATGCTTSLTHTLMVYKPSVSITGPSTICLHHAATLTATGAQNYLWNGSQTGSALALPTSSGSTHSVVGTDAFGCADTAFHSVAGVYSAAFSVGGGTMCSGRGFVFTPTLITQPPGGNLTMQVTSSTALIIQPFGSVSVNPASTQQYSITVHASAGCTSTVAVVGLSVSPTPTLSAPVPSLCVGLQPTITVSGSPSYTVTHLSASHIFALGSSAAGCISDTLHIYPIIYPSPTITAVSGSICAGKGFFISTSGAATYSITGNSFSVSPAQTSTYAVSGLSSHGCSPAAPTLVTVTVVPIPLVSVNSGSICAGSSFTLLPSGADSYTITGGLYTITPATTTSYSLTGSTSGCASSNTAVATVTVAPNPTLNVVPLTATICVNQVFTFKAFGASSYSWNGISGTNSHSVTPPASTIYTVHGTNAQGCRDSLTVKITVEECAAIGENFADHELRVFPNPSSGIFYVHSPETATLKLYDACGRLVAEERVGAGEKVEMRVPGPGVYFLIAQQKGRVVRRLVTNNQ